MCNQVFSPESLQRYMTGDKALQVIEDEGLYFRRIDGYKDDPTEGDYESFGKKEEIIFNIIIDKFPIENQVSPEKGREIANDNMQEEKKNIFIQSWFFDKNMSKIMWHRYGGYNKSPDCALFIVNRFTLLSYLDSILPVGYKMEHVKYVANKEGQREPVFTKNKYFADEQELRISIDISKLIFFNNKILPEINHPAKYAKIYIEGRPANEYVSKNYANNGIAKEDNFQYVDDFGFILKAPLPDFLEGVYIPSEASQKFCTDLDKLLASKGHAIRCKRIDVQQLPDLTPPATDA